MMMTGEIGMRGDRDRCMMRGNRYNQRQGTCVSTKLMRYIIYRRKDYTRPVNFVSSNQREDEDDGDSDSDKEVPKMFLIALDVNFVAFSQDLDEATKHILEALDQRKLQEVGEKVGVGKFRTASLEKNKKLSMFSTDQTTKTTG